LSLSANVAVDQPVVVLRVGDGSAPALSPLVIDGVDTSGLGQVQLSEGLIAFAPAGGVAVGGKWPAGESVMWGVPSGNLSVEPFVATIAPGSQRMVGNGSVPAGVHFPNLGPYVSTSAVGLSGVSASVDVAPGAVSVSVSGQGSVTTLDGHAASGALSWTFTDSSSCRQCADAKLTSTGYPLGTLTVGNAVVDQQVGGPSGISVSITGTGLTGALGPLTLSDGNAQISLALLPTPTLRIVGTGSVGKVTGKVDISGPWSLGNLGLGFDLKGTGSLDFNGGATASLSDLEVNVPSSCQPQQSCPTTVRTDGTLNLGSSVAIPFTGSASVSGAVGSLHLTSTSPVTLAPGIVLANVSLDSQPDGSLALTGSGSLFGASVSATGPVTVSNNNASYDITLTATGPITFGGTAVSFGATLVIQGTFGSSTQLSGSVEVLDNSYAFSGTLDTTVAPWKLSLANLPGDRLLSVSATFDPTANHLVGSAKIGTFVVGGGSVPLSGGIEVDSVNASFDAQPSATPVVHATGIVRIGGGQIAATVDYVSTSSCSSCVKLTASGSATLNPGTPTEVDVSNLQIDALVSLTGPAKASLSGGATLALPQAGGSVNVSLTGQLTLSGGQITSFQFAGALNQAQFGPVTITNLNFTLAGNMTSATLTVYGNSGLNLGSSSATANVNLKGPVSIAGGNLSYDLTGSGSITLNNGTVTIKANTLTLNNGTLTLDGAISAPALAGQGVNGTIPIHATIEYGVSPVQIDFNTTQDAPLGPITLAKNSNARLSVPSSTATLTSAAIKLTGQGVSGTIGLQPNTTNTIGLSPLNYTLNLCTGNGCPGTGSGLSFDNGAFDLGGNLKIHDDASGPSTADINGSLYFGGGTSSVNGTIGLQDGNPSFSLNIAQQTPGTLLGTGLFFASATLSGTSSNINFSKVDVDVSDLPTASGELTGDLTLTQDQQNGQTVWIASTPNPASLDVDLNQAKLDLQAAITVSGVIYQNPDRTLNPQLTVSAPQITLYDKTAGTAQTITNSIDEPQVFIGQAGATVIGGTLDIKTPIHQSAIRGLTVTGSGSVSGPLWPAFDLKVSNAKATLSGLLPSQSSCSGPALGATINLGGDLEIQSSGITVSNGSFNPDFNGATFVGPVLVDEDVSLQSSGLSGVIPLDFSSFGSFYGTGKMTVHVANDTIPNGGDQFQMSGPMSIALDLGGGSPGFDVDPDGDSGSISGAPNFEGAVGVFSLVAGCGNSATLSGRIPGFTDQLTGNAMGSQWGIPATISENIPSSGLPYGSVAPPAPSGKPCTSDGCGLVVYDYAPAQSLYPGVNAGTLYYFSGGTAWPIHDPATAAKVISQGTNVTYVAAPASGGTTRPGYTAYQTPVTGDVFQDMNGKVFEVVGDNGGAQNATCFTATGTPACTVEQFASQASYNAWVAAGDAVSPPETLPSSNGAALLAENGYSLSSTTPSFYPPPVAHDAYPGSVSANLPSTSPLHSISVDLVSQDQGHNIAVTAHTSSHKGSVACTAGEPPQPEVTTCTYTPNDYAFGSDSFTYTITDDQGLKATATVYVSITTPAPTAPNQTYSTMGGQAVSFSLYRPSGNNMAPSAWDGAQLYISRLGQPPHGQTSCDTNDYPSSDTNAGDCTYTPNYGYSGTDSLGYWVTDDAGNSKSGTISINVQAPSGPTISQHPHSTVTSDGSSVTQDMLQYASGATGDPLSLDPSSIGILPNGQVGRATGHGNVVCPTSGMSNPRDCTYTPNRGFAGTETITYKIEDPYGLHEASGEWDITVNAPPGCGAYPAGVIGPGCSNFSTVAWWGTGGCGLAGKEIWTYAYISGTHSYAHWSFTGLGSGNWFKVYAWIPKCDSDAPNAHYSVNNGDGTVINDYLNQQLYGDEWAYLGYAYSGSSGNVTVTLGDDSNPSGTWYVGADGMELEPSAGPCPHCS
jgi:Bacterial Ig domain